MLLLEEKIHVTHLSYRLEVLFDTFSLDQFSDTLKLIHKLQTKEFIIDTVDSHYFYSGITAVRKPDHGVHVIGRSRFIYQFSIPKNYLENIF